MGRETFRRNVCTGGRNFYYMKNIKQRTCIGCNRTGDKNEFVRVVLLDDQLTIDVEQNQDGRGIYLCPMVDCLEKAKRRRAVNHRLKTRLSGKELEKFYILFLDFINK